MAKNSQNVNGLAFIVLWTINEGVTRDVPDPDTGYPVKFRHPALSGINLPDIYRIVL